MPRRDTRLAAVIRAALNCPQANSRRQHIVRPLLVARSDGLRRAMDEQDLEHPTSLDLLVDEPEQTFMVDRRDVDADIGYHDPPSAPYGCIRGSQSRPAWAGAHLAVPFLVLLVGSI